MSRPAPESVARLPEPEPSVLPEPDMSQVLAEIAEEARVSPSDWLEDARVPEGGE